MLPYCMHTLIHTYSVWIFSNICFFFMQIRDVCIKWQIIIYIYIHIHSGLLVSRICIYFLCHLLINALIAYTLFRTITCVNECKAFKSSDWSLCKNFDSEFWTVRKSVWASLLMVTIRFKRYSTNTICIMAILPGDAMAPLIPLNTVAVSHF